MQAYSRVCVHTRILQVSTNKIPKDVVDVSVQVWNHPWVLKLSAARQAEKEEREALFEETDDETLGGFIVSEGSDVEEERERMTRTKNKKVSRSL